MKTNSSWRTNNDIETSILVEYIMKEILNNVSDLQVGLLAALHQLVEGRCSQVGVDMGRV